MSSTVRCLCGLVMLVWACHSGYAQQVERDVAYGAEAGQRLDLSVPAGTRFPTVLFFHGGGLTGGDKADEDYRRVCEQFAVAGIGCANVNYRLGPAHKWPAQAEDVAFALAWVRANIGARGGDPAGLFLMGHSSGAALVALVAGDERYFARAGLRSRDVKGVVAMGSLMWDVDLKQAVSQHGRARVEEAFTRDPDNAMFQGLDAYLDRWPMRHVRAGMPPILFLIAESEREQPPVLMTNRAFADSARSLGNRADYEVLAGRTHYSAVRRLHEPNDSVFQRVRDFIRQLAVGSTH